MTGGGPTNRKPSRYFLSDVPEPIVAEETYYSFLSSTQT
jgi:hypothetical protein